MPGEIAGKVVQGRYGEYHLTATTVCPCGVELTAAGHVRQQVEPVMEARLVPDGEGHMLEMRVDGVSRPEFWAGHS